MSLTPVEELPPSSRVWIFGSDRFPGAEEAAHLLDSLRRFLEGWTAHDRRLQAGFDWRHHRFLVVTVDEGAAAASGCSIDALVNHLKTVEEETGLGLVDTSPVWYRDPLRGGRIRTVSRSRFRELAVAGKVGPDTVVFDLTVERLADVRDGQWELPARESWHAVLLPDAGGDGGDTTG